MKTKIFLIAFLILNSLFLNAQLENSGTHRNMFLSTCCGEFSLSDASKSSITDTIFCERWDNASGTFKPFNMTVNTFDAKGRMVESLSGYYYSNGSFKNNARYEFTYFPFDSLLSETHYYWNDTMNGTGAWENFRQYEYTYDIYLRLIEEESLYSPSGTSVWQNSTRDYLSYAPNGKIDNQISEYWNPNVNAWWNYIRHRYVYDQNNYMLVKYFDYSNNASGTWDNSSRFVYNYAKNLEVETQQVYTNPGWRNTYRKTHILNSIGIAEEILKEMWNTLEMNWDTMFREKDLFIYNSGGQLEEHIYMSSYIQWFNVSRETYTYDFNGKLIEKQEFEWNHNDSLWMHTIMCTYTSTPITLSFGTNDAVEFNIYPNPAVDYLNIVPGDELLKGLDVYLLNTAGQVLKEIHQINNDAIRIDIKGYPRGVYFIRIEVAGHSGVVRKVLFQ